MRFDFGFGIRVPLLVISPYAKRGYVDHEVGEFSTPLRFISDNWDLPYLNERLHDNDLLVLVGAREGTFSWRPALNRLPRILEPIGHEPTSETGVNAVSGS